MGNIEIQAARTAQTNSANKPSEAKRIGVTLVPGLAAASIFVKSLGKGKSIYDAGNDVITTFKEVHEANKDVAKKNIKEMAESAKKYPFLTGGVGISIILLDKIVNE